MGIGPGEVGSRVTRGKTRPGRLERLDPWFAAHVGTWPDAGPDTVVDVGIGASPETTLELHAALAAVRPGVRIVGLDTDPERVRALAQVAGPGVVALHGGFEANIPGRAGLVRAANLLRQYRLDGVPDALARMGAWLQPGGLLVEGTTDASGDRGVFRVLRQDGEALRPKALLILADPEGPFAPRALTPYLPRGLGWHGHVAPRLRTLFDAWEQAFKEARATATGPLFAPTCARLAAVGLAVDAPDAWARGVLELPVDLDLVAVHRL